MKKSQIVGLLLTFLFGFIGLFYSNVTAAIGFAVISIMLISASGGVLVIIVWPMGMILSWFVVRRYNKKIELEEKRHSELMEAARNNASPTAQ